MDRFNMTENIEGRLVMTNQPCIEVHSTSSYDKDQEREEHEAKQRVTEARKTPPLGCNHNHHEAADGIGNNRRRLLSKQLSMKETTREAKWEKRRQQVLRRSSMVSVNDDGGGGGNKRAVEERHHDHHHVMRSSSEHGMRCLTDEDLDELRGSFELGFGFNEGTGGAHLRDTLPALEFYFAVNRQLLDPKLQTLVAASPTSTLSAMSSSSTLPDPYIPSPSSPNAVTTTSGGADGWKIFTPGDNPQFVKMRLRHWAQVVACSIKHG